MQELERIQDWYISQCNEDWEHSFGVRIDTLDNPGWTVEVDLRETELADKAFEVMARGDSESDADWIHCKVDSEKFIASGGAANLAELLNVFLLWAGR